MNTQVSKQKIWTIVAIIGALVSVWFLWPQLMTLLFAALMSYLFYPLFQKIRNKNKNKKNNIAATISLVTSFLVVIIPVAFILVATISQVVSFADYLGQAGTWDRLPEFSRTIINRSDDVVSNITGKRPSITEAGIIDYLRNTLPGLVRAATGASLGVIASVPQMGIALLIYIFAFMEFTLRGPSLINKLKKISPFSADDTDQYIERVGLMANAMVKGQLMISVVISFVSASLLSLLGYGNYFFIFLVLFTILNFIPLGCGIVLVPLTIYSMLTGQFWLGLVVLVLYYLTGYLDPLLRPKFIPKTIEMSTAWTIIATFCGIAYFGILGVVYGPIIMILITTTWELYINSKNQKATSSKAS